MARGTQANANRYSCAEAQAVWEVMMKSQLFHNGQTWILELSTDDAMIQLAISDGQAQELQDFGISVFAA